jgi:hypothetical protein
MTLAWFLFILMIIVFCIYILKTMKANHDELMNNHKELIDTLDKIVVNSTPQPPQPYRFNRF